MLILIRNSVAIENLIRSKNIKKLKDENPSLVLKGLQNVIFTQSLISTFVTLYLAIFILGLHANT